MGPPFLHTNIKNAFKEKKRGLILKLTLLVSLFPHDNLSLSVTQCLRTVFWFIGFWVVYCRRASIMTRSKAVLKFFSCDYKHQNFGKHQILCVIHICSIHIVTDLELSYFKILLLWFHFPCPVFCVQGPLLELTPLTPLSGLSHLLYTELSRKKRLEAEFGRRNGRILD